MTRKLIATEGILSEIPNTWLAPGSIRMDEGARLPITMGFDYSKHNDVVGSAQDLQRDEETGELTIDVTDLSIDVDEKDYDYTFYATDVVFEQVEATEEVPEHRLVTEARIRGIAIVPNAALPRRFSQKLQGS
jgi:hypothetical protein